MQCVFEFLIPLLFPRMGVLLERRCIIAISAQNIMGIIIEPLLYALECFAGKQGFIIRLQQVPQDVLQAVIHAAQHDVSVGKQNVAVQAIAA